jgi:hypothetical protein
MKLDDIRNLDRNDLLELLGLERKPPQGARIADALGTFGLGLLLGAGVALLLAPKPGRKLREEIRDRLQRASGG